MLLTSGCSNFLPDHSGLRRPHLALISIQLLRKGTVIPMCFSSVVTDLAPETSANLNVPDTQHCMRGLLLCYYWETTRTQYFQLGPGT